MALRASVRVMSSFLINLLIDLYLLVHKSLTDIVIVHIYTTCITSSVGHGAYICGDASPSLKFCTIDNCAISGPSEMARDDFEVLEMAPPA